VIGKTKEGLPRIYADGRGSEKKPTTEAPRHREEQKRENHR